MRKSKESIDKHYIFVIETEINEHLLTDKYDKRIIHYDAIRMNNPDPNYIKTSIPFSTKPLGIFYIPDLYNVLYKLDKKFENKLLNQTNQKWFALTDEDVEYLLNYLESC